VTELLVPPRIAASLDAGRRKSNLAFALRVLPRQRRADALEFYRFCRVVDDIADSPHLDPGERKASLDAWLAALADPDLAGIPAPLARVIRTHDLDRSLMAEIVRGVAMDATATRYATFDDLRVYCWRVASAVGLVSIKLFGCTQPSSAAYAEALGLALQLTNILRDVGEDADLGRIYLPLEDLARFGIPESAILHRAWTEPFADLMHFEADRADGFYAQALAALTDGDRRALRAAEIMRAIYSKLLGRMRADGFRVFEHRYRLSHLTKLITAAATLRRRK